MMLAIKWHIFLCTAALIVMGFAGIQAVFLMLQDYYLRRYKLYILSFLPSMEKLEKYLFRTIIAGWLLLSAVFISSIIFFEHIFALPLYEKTFLTLITWSIFTLLLTGRYLAGWRGRAAIRWAFSGVMLLLVIYCGTGLWFHVSN